MVTVWCSGSTLGRDQHICSTLDRAPIDQLFSRESSASLNLVGDQAAHPVYDHLRSWLCMPPTQTDAVRNDSAPGHSPSSVECNLTLLWHPCYLDESLPILLLRPCSSSSNCAVYSLYMHTSTVWSAHWQHCFVCV